MRYTYDTRVARTLHARHTCARCVENMIMRCKCNCSKHGGRRSGFFVGSDFVVEVRVHRLIAHIIDIVVMTDRELRVNISFPVAPYRTANMPHSTGRRSGHMHTEDIAQYLLQ